MRHELKTHPEPFEEVRAGRKRHEVRQNDRTFNAGDELLLREWAPLGGYLGLQVSGHTGREYLVRITHITRGGEWGLPQGIDVLSIEPVRKPYRSPTAFSRPIDGSTGELFDKLAEHVVELENDQVALRRRAEAAEAEVKRLREACKMAAVPTEDRFTGYEIKTNNLELLEAVQSGMLACRDALNSTKGGGK